MKSKFFIGIIILLSACLDSGTPSPHDQAQKDIKAIDDYLAANPPAPTDLIIKDATGIRLVITQVGTGSIPPNPENNVGVAYVGKLFSNGQIFDSRSSSDPYYLRLSDPVIDGWKIGLSLLTQGAKATLYIPSGYAYGPSGRDGIPGNAILKFDIEMVLVEPTSEQEAILSSQMNAISATLEGVENVILDPSGISIIHTQVGTGLTPSLYDQVRVKYSGRLLSNGTEIFPLTERGPAADFSSRVVNYLHGHLVVLQQMQEGGKATIYVPATLAYGPVAVPNIPANSNLIYEIELLQVIR